MHIGMQASKQPVIYTLLSHFSEKVSQMQDDRDDGLPMLYTHRHVMCWGSRSLLRLRLPQ